MRALRKAIAQHLVLGSDTITNLTSATRVSTGGLLFIRLLLGLILPFLNGYFVYAFEELQRISPLSPG